MRRRSAHAALILTCLLASVATAEGELDLQILEPQDGQVFEPDTARLKLRGRLRASSSANLSVNGQPLNLSAERWSVELELADGLNVFEVVAFDSQGQRATERLRVRRRDRRHGLDHAARKRGFGAAGPSEPMPNTERLDFVDTTTGAPTRRLTGLRSIDRPHYTDHMTWSANGDALVFQSHRAPEGSWRVAVDGSGLRHVDRYAVQSDALDPRFLYTVERRKGSLRNAWRVVRLRSDASPDERELIFEIPAVDPRLHANVLGVHRDGRKLLVGVGGQNRYGIPSRIYLVDTQGETTVGFRAPGTLHRVAFTGSDRYDVFFSLAASMAGRGPGSNWCGAEFPPERCRGAAEGGFLLADPFAHLSQGRAEADWISDEAVCRISSEKVSHPGFAPDGSRILASRGRNLFDANGEWVWHTGFAVSALDCAGDLAVDSRLQWGLPASAHPAPGHRSWKSDGDWVVVHSGRRLFRVGTDGWYATSVARPNTAEERGDYDANAFPVTSPDGTKIAYASTMLGDADLYSVVLRLPDAPGGLRVESQRRLLRDREVLAWSAPQRAREVAGYAVFGSERSGGPYQRQNVKAIEATDWRIPAEAPRFLVVAAIEHSGLVGLPSPEVSRVLDVDGPRVIRVEAESGRLSRPFALAYDGDYSGLYAVRVVGPNGGRLRNHEGGPGAWPVPAPDQGGLDLDVVVPAAGRYRVWAYTRGHAGGAFALRGPGGESGRAAAQSNGWRWQPVVAGAAPLELDLGVGSQRLRLSSQAAEVLVDQLVLTTDADLRPERPPHALPITVRPPESDRFSTLRARPLSSFACRVDWRFRESDAGGLVHVYRDGRRREPLSNRIATVRGTSFVDTGVRPGARHRYWLRRQMSDGSLGKVAATKCDTPPLADAVRLDIAPSSADSVVVLHFDLPQPDRYVLWALVRPRQSRPSSRETTLCLSRGDAGCTRDESLFSRRWALPLGAISLPRCCPFPVVPDEWVWVAVPLGSEPPAQVSRLEAGPHTLTLTPARADPIDVCAAVVSNDPSFVPIDDPSLPRGRLGYGLPRTLGAVCPRRPGDTPARRRRGPRDR